MGLGGGGTSAGRLWRLLAWEGGKEWEDVQDPRARVGDRLLDFGLGGGGGAGSGGLGRGEEGEDAGGDTGEGGCCVCESRRW